MKNKVVINLFEFDNIALIISHPTGVFYSNQTGGYTCLSSEFEGAFVPLKNALVDQQPSLNAISPARNGVGIVTIILTRKLPILLMLFWLLHT